MSDDYASSTSTTGSVAVGGSATGEIETSGDRDWFAVTLEAGRTYRIDLEGLDTGSSSEGTNRILWVDSNPYTYPTWGADRCALPDITALTANASGTPNIAL